jgi:hypothetical protein
VDVCFDVVTLSESLVELFDFTLKAFRLTNGLDPPGKCRKIAHFLSR